MYVFLNLLLLIIFFKTRYFDKNMELFFNTRQLEWCFLDKRRGYLDNIYGRGAAGARKRTTSVCMEDFIRPYQVIPSCLLMYRFLCMFLL